MRLTKAERTTTINYDEEGEYAEVTTYSKTLINSLRKNTGAEEVDIYPAGGVCFRVSKKLVNVRNPRRASGRKPMTQAQKDAARDRLAAARAAKNEGT